jgi:hypothetical protein
MPTFTLIFQKSLRVIPTRSAWVEAWGFLVFGIGLFLGLSLYSFSTRDYVGLYLNPVELRNLGGPMGAKIARDILFACGMLGMTWPLAIGTWVCRLATRSWIFRLFDSRPSRLRFCRSTIAPHGHCRACVWLRR